MDTFDDNSEGKMSIDRPKIMFTNFNFGYTLRTKNLKFFYNNCMLLFYVF